VKRKFIVFLWESYNERRNLEDLNIGGVVVIIDLREKLCHGMGWNNVAQNSDQ
jgi:hypothetical protein